jgi:enoyl-[acyl-carrier protein] reductase I
MLLNLTGKKALIIGVANQNSMWWSIAQQLHQAGANNGFTFLPDPT